MAEKVLIVEDDVDLQNILNELLQSEGFLTETASTGSDALRKIDKVPPKMILLDLGLPDIQGETILQKVREERPEIPIVILTAKSKPNEIAEGLKLGADDYLAKPFAAEELLARIYARLKTNSVKTDKMIVEDLVLDLNKMTVIRSDKKIELTKTEFNLLKFLIENKNKVLTRDVILNHVWEYTPDVESRVVDVYIGYLRKKVDNGFAKKLIKNKRGFGYIIEV